MPWTSDDATGHNKRANTPRKRKIWSRVANQVLEETGDEGRAVRIANHAVRNASKKSAELWEDLRSILEK